MSLADPGPEAVGSFWTRHNASDHDDVVTTGATHLQHLVYDEAAGLNQWKNTGSLSAPVLAATAGAGVGATIVTAAGGYAAATDARGTVTVTPAGTPATGTLCTITLGKPMPAGVLPHVHITPVGAAANTCQLYVLSASATVVTIGAAVAPTAAAALTFTYSIEG